MFLYFSKTNTCPCEGRRWGRSSCTCLPVPHIYEQIMVQPVHSAERPVVHGVDDNPCARTVDRSRDAASFASSQGRRSIDHAMQLVLSRARADAWPVGRLAGECTHGRTAGQRAHDAHAQDTRENGSFHTLGPEG